MGRPFFCPSPAEERQKKSENKHQSLQPPALAAFLPWGGSEGADCALLTQGSKVHLNFL